MKISYSIYIVVFLLIGTSFSGIAVNNLDNCENNNQQSTCLLNQNLQPEIIIGNITGGFRKIVVEIKNIGTEEANDINWEITIAGGLLINLNEISSGIIDRIESGGNELIEVQLPFGMGEITIDITIEETIGKSINGYLFFFFVRLNDEITIDFDIIAEGFNSPIYLTHAGDDTNRLFVVDQIGKIFVIENNEVLTQPFLDISDKIVDLDITYDERGLLGLAFHPNYKENNKFYIYYSAPKNDPGINSETILAEYQVSENINIANPDSERIIIRIDQPEANHNGGQILFGSDGYLYLGLGDGGGAGDRHGTIGNGQDIQTALGSIIRLDIDTGDPYSIPSDNPFINSEGLDEIYAWGFRNPWRFSFDFETDNFFIADVGQDEWEEINIMNEPGNFGWRILEGTHDYDRDLADELGIDISSLVMPIHEYSHNLGRSITGGYVYRGNENPELYGKYIFGDWSSSFVLPRGQLFYLEETTPGNWQRFDLSTRNTFNRFILSFGQDENGEIYVLSKTTLGPTGSTGDVRKILI